MENKYLLAEDDGLPMRASQDYAKDKLRILEDYVYKFITAMRVKPWRALYYIDLQAGPGKNFFERSNEVMLGSPLIALNSQHAFTDYRFVELDRQNFEALQKRISMSERVDRVKVMHGDCNTVVREIVEEILAIDQPFISGRWNSLNLAFLDPNGLELQWQTVETLASVRGMDLIINFSTNALTRNMRQLIQSGKTDVIDKYFGTLEWRNVYNNVAEKDSTHIRRTMIDFYKARLHQFGYKTVGPNGSPLERIFRNSKGRQIYTLIAASKHDLGVKFWQTTITDSPRQRPLF